MSLSVMVGCVGSHGCTLSVMVGCAGSRGCTLSVHGGMCWWDVLVAMDVH